MLARTDYKTTLWLVLLTLIACTHEPVVVSPSPTAKPAPSIGSVATRPSTTVPAPTPAAAPSESTTSAPSDVSDADASTGARTATFPCYCFSWVHLADFGKSCELTMKECETSRARGFPPGRGGTMRCERTDCSLRSGSPGGADAGVARKQ
ncbi:MAG: hypothetical protein ACHREM_01375 [Polyangiales bacterium]